MTSESEILAPFPPGIPTPAASVAALLPPGETIVVLDDDPTGTQSVSDLPVLTRWQEDDFDWALGLDAPAVYVLTNTRSLTPAAAAERNREIVHNATAAARRAGRALRFASRSDSTLRGHFPLETDVIAETLAAQTGESVDGVVVVPAFPDAGRVTIGGTHYMRQGRSLVPVAETEFANDATFGYANSGLAAWVEEKTAGRIAAADVIVLDLATIRAGAEAVADAMDAAGSATPIVADAVDEDDLRMLGLGILEAERRGKRLLYRVGPPFVRARIGQERREPLRASEVYAGNGTDGLTLGGLVVVGSHVGLTSRQLARLVDARPNAVRIEIDVQEVLDPARSAAHLESVAGRVIRSLSDGDVIVNTSRLLHRTDDPDESLDISRRVSAAVVDVVQRTLAAVRPRFVIAKGGITSSDVAAHGLGIRHAIVRGPMLPGIVSLWQPVDGAAVGIPYIVFAGNVGDDESLAAVVATLSSPA